jgi:hypothetical protein
MKRFLVLACGLVSLTAAAVDSAPAGAMSAAQIVDRNLAARGGLTAWRAVDNLTLAGQMDAGGKPEVQLPFVMKMKRAHKSRLELQFQGQTAVQVYDGAQGWKLRPFLGRDEAEPLTLAETQSAASWEELDGPLVDNAKKGTRITLQGQEVVEGHAAYKLKLTGKNGVERHLWIDAKSFLELKIEGEPRRIDGRLHNVAIHYRDYKPEKGLMVAHSLETVVEGVKQSHKMLIEKVSFNQPMENRLFVKPSPSVVQVSAR